MFKKKGKDGEDGKKKSGGLAGFKAGLASNLAAIGNEVATKGEAVVEKVKEKTGKGDRRASEESQPTASPPIVPERPESTPNPTTTESAEPNAAPAAADASADTEGGSGADAAAADPVPDPAAEPEAGKADPALSRKFSQAAKKHVEQQRLAKEAEEAKETEKEGQASARAGSIGNMMDTVLDETRHRVSSSVSIGSLASVKDNRLGVSNDGLRQLVKDIGEVKGDVKTYNDVVEKVIIPKTAVLPEGSRTYTNYLVKVCKLKKTVNRRNVSHDALLEHPPPNADGSPVPPFVDRLRAYLTVDQMSSKKKKSDEFAYVDLVCNDMHQRRELDKPTDPVRPHFYPYDAGFGIDK